MTHPGDTSSDDVDQYVEEHDIPVNSKYDGNKDLLEPYRIQINLLGAHKELSVLEEIMEAVVDEAEKRGLVFSYGGMQRMPYEDIIPDSIFEQIVTGRPPRIQ